MIIKCVMMGWMASVAFAHPFIQVDIANKKPKQGDAVWVKIKSAKEVASGHVALNKKTFKVFKKNNKREYVTCIGISRYIKPQTVPLKFSLTFKDGSQYRTSLPISIESANFKKEHIKLKPKKYKISQDRSSRKKEGALIGKAFRIVTVDKDFSGAFEWPVKGRISSEFGTQRVYNNTPGWSHSGTDIAASLDTPIKATQSGTVVLASELKVHGKTIMINHGWGIVSVYNHLNKLNVSLNDKVTKGDIIGTVGSTGIATGTHLHFGISIQSIRVNPKDWVYQTSKITI